MQKNHFLGKLSGLLILSAVLVLLGTLLGSAGSSWNLQGSDQTILFDIRLPRSLGAYLAGALLGLAGGIAQSLFRNPLADPYLLGSASGALLGVGSILCFAYLGNSWLEVIGLNGGAFLGALIGVLASLVLAGGYRSSLRLLLSGVVISVILGAANSLFTFIRPDLFQSIQSFMLGNTTLLNWSGVEMMTIALFICILTTLIISPVLDALSLGENTARTLGLPLDQLRLILIGILALATGCAVAQTGLVAFVGLAAPHLVRKLSGGRQRAQLVFSCLSGGILLLSSDLIARTLFAPIEIPVGVVTAVLGGIYLLVLLRRAPIGVRS
ncbi:iron ABC transporter permease [Polynucleobacter sp. 78F-HAINBA]|jgi:iron complex transport system permease protein|uniref:FecCD family ABC transporter permease n=1 Tax=Polynucleobacter sp. 78F-HAINBA TaxID=2689099 RepID=UPI001C0DB95C|nr:iron ABC transporter permease [Polynucleobacter sp. 78F-HAINBA]MBU3590508.1 iron ABC transporter permease [Polynucleobacter sp. 78F-HAINBA]